ncbi:MAG: carboxypeptidase regulatory-like domain-containing protein, partial [Terracidiphilus sp.]
MRRASLTLFILLLLSALPAAATVFATVHGVVHDPAHRPVAGAEVALQAEHSAFVLHATTAANGEFELPQAPIGVYRLLVSAPGFDTVSESLTLASGTNPVLHIPLSLASATQSVVVTASDAPQLTTDTVTPTTLITRQMIDNTPGASRTTGMEMITDYVPGSYMTHDMLHMRGGHQTSWLIDGVSIPNTKIDSNVGPQIDPKDIDQLETQRGSYASDIGDRTYGVFNVLPRNGFERDHQAELLLSAGNLYTSEAQFSLGDHTAKTAWYASATG